MTDLTTRTDSRKDLIVGMLACFVLAAIFFLVARWLLDGAQLYAAEAADQLESASTNRERRRIRGTRRNWFLFTYGAFGVSGLSTFVGLWCGWLAAFGKKPD